MVDIVPDTRSIIANRQAQSLSSLSLSFFSVEEKELDKLIASARKQTKRGRIYF